MSVSMASLLTCLLLRRTKGVYYFEAKVSNGKRSARVVSFEALKKAEAEQSVVALGNTTVKKSCFSSELEVHMNKRSKMTVSLRKLFLGERVAVLSPSSKAVKIAQIVDLTVNQGIRVVGKVVKVSDVEVVKRGDGKELKKQNVVIGDETGSCRMVWAATMLPLKPQPVVCGLQHSKVEGIHKLLQPVTKEPVCNCWILIDCLDVNRWSIIVFWADETS